MEFPVIWRVAQPQNHLRTETAGHSVGDILSLGCVCSDSATGPHYSRTETYSDSRSGYDLYLGVTRPKVCCRSTCLLCGPGCHCIRRKCKQIQYQLCEGSIFIVVFFCVTGFDISLEDNVVALDGISFLGVNVIFPSPGCLCPGLCNSIASQTS